MKEITGVEVKRLWDAYQANYKFERLAAALTYAYIHGFQTKDIDTTRLSFTGVYNQPEERGITEFPCNQLIDPYRQYRYELISKDIDPECIPAQKNDPEATESAPRLNELLDYLRTQSWDNEGLNKSLAAWALSCGTVYTMLYPENDGEGYAYAVVDGRIVTELKEENGKYTYRERPVNAERKTPKKLSAVARTIWEVASSCDGEYNKLDTSTWQILKSIKTIAHIRKLAGDKIANDIGKGIDQQAAGLRPLWADDIAAATGVPTGEGAGTFTGDDRQVWCYSYYHRGGQVRTYAETAGGMTEIYSANQLPLDKIMPFRQFDVTENNAHRYVQLSPFYHAIGLQTIYNSIVNSRAAHERLAARPPMEMMVGIEPSPETEKTQGWGGTSRYPTYAEIFRWTATGEAKSMVAGNPAALQALKPDFMTIPSVGPGVVEFLDKIRLMIVDVLGTGMANMGRMPVSVSGTSLEVQGAIDNTGYVALIKAWQAFKKSFWWDVLKAIPLVYDKTDVAKMLHQPITKIDAIFTNSIADSYDLKYIDTSALPSSPVLRIEKVTNLMAVLPPQLQMQAVKLITNIMGDIGLNIGVPNIEEELAEKENEFILNDESLLAMYRSKDPKDKEAVGQILFGLATPLQDDATHDGVHRKPIIGPEALNHAPERLEMLTLHIQIHEQNRLQKQIGSQPIEGDTGEAGTKLQTSDTALPPGAANTPDQEMPGGV